MEPKNTIPTPDAVPPVQPDYFPSPALPPVPEPPKPKSKRKLIIVVVIVLVVMIGAAVALVSLLSSKSKTTNQTATTANSGSTSADPDALMFLHLIEEHKLDEAYGYLNPQKYPKDLFTNILAPKLGINYKLSECKVLKTEEAKGQLITSISCGRYDPSKKGAVFTFTSDKVGDKWIINSYTASE